MYYSISCLFIYNTSQDLTEINIHRYKETVDGSYVERPDIPTTNHPDIGLQHPFDNDQNFLNRLLVGFCGYFNCG